MPGPAPRRLAPAVFVLAVLAAWQLRAAPYPAPVEADYVARDFHFTSGESLGELRLHYRTVGGLERDAAGRARNAVLILHGTGGDGGGFVRPGRGGEAFAGELFGAGQPLDASRYFIVLPDGIGHGKSSKPSDGLAGRFPRYGYRDMVEAQRLVLEHLGVDHLRLVLGTSMGGMQTWLWGGTHPEFMDALVPLASLPTQISGRNRMWRRIVMDAIRNDPQWDEGNYQAQPPGLKVAAEMLYFMSGTPRMRQAEAPTLEAADRSLDRVVGFMLGGMDANDLLRAVDASRDYDPGPLLGRIRAPLLAINFADDLINPPELGILETEIRRVPRGRALLIPASDATVGHATHSKAVVWRDAFAAFMRETE